VDFEILFLIRNHHLIFPKAFTPSHSSNPSLQIYTSTLLSLAIQRSHSDSPT